MAESCGAAGLANTLMDDLMEGRDTTLPPVDWSQFQYPTGVGPIHQPIEKLTNDDLTTRTVGGTGTFDAIMDGLSAHLKKEFDSNRITGAEYTKAYIGITTAALGAAVQYLLGRDQAHWQSLLVQQQTKIAQLEAINTRLKVETSKVELLNADAEYGLTKMKIATEDATYCNLSLDKNIKEFNLDNLMPIQEKLLQEQVEVQRAQTMDTRTDGITVIKGSVGKQKDLYTQQITSYQRDSEVKAAKLFTDAWITQKTIDEGLIAPNNFTNASLDIILGKLKLNNSFT